MRKPLVARAQYDFSAFSVREDMRRRVNPKVVTDTLLGILCDPGASDRDRIMAARTIMDRRDGMPVATVLTATASVDRALAELPQASLAQIESVLRAQLQLESGEGQDELEHDEHPNAINV